MTKQRTYQTELSAAIRTVHNGDGYDVPGKTLRRLINRGFIEAHKDHYRVTPAGRRFANLSEAA